MENIREQQEEALKAVFDYNKKLIPALEELVIELRGAHKEDTQEYLNYILKGINWVIQVVNGTKNLINQEEQIVSKEQINDIILGLNNSINEENNMEIAELIETGILPFINSVSSAAKQIIKLEEMQ